MEPESLRPLLWLVLLLQGLTLLLLVAGPSPQRQLPSSSQPGLAALPRLPGLSIAGAPMNTSRGSATASKQSENPSSSDR